MFEPPNFSQHVHLPEHLAGRGVERGDVAAGAVGVEPIAVDRRRRARAVAAIVAEAPAVRDLPHLLAGGRVEGHHVLRPAARAQRVQASVRRRERRVPVTGAGRLPGERRATRRPVLEEAASRRRRRRASRPATGASRPAPRVETTADRDRTKPAAAKTTIEGEACSACVVSLRPAETAPGARPCAVGSTGRGYDARRVMAVCFRVSGSARVQGRYASPASHR